MTVVFVVKKLKIYIIIHIKSNMNLNYDCLFLIKEQVKLDFFLQYSCKAFKNESKNVITNSFRYCKKYRIGILYTYDPFTSLVFKWDNERIKTYITSILDGLDKSKYGIIITYNADGSKEIYTTIGGWMIELFYRKGKKINLGPWYY